MKTSIFRLFGAVLFLGMLTQPVWAQRDMDADSTGLPGDHFSLEAAVELFKSATSPEDFEQKLNSENNDVNNLDLNEDGEVDYIRVVDNMEGDAHALVLQVALSETESQDVAVIAIEKQGAESAILQIVGDENLYGSETIAEPLEEEAVKSGREKGPAALGATVRLVVNVWAWPSVRFMYAPSYRVWVSPYLWRSYPRAWRPWRPAPYRVFYVRTLPHRAHCHVVRTHRVPRARAVYAPHRRQSTVVHTRTTTVVKARGNRGTAVERSGRNTQTTPRNGRVKQRTTTTTTVKKGRNGQNGTKKTTTKTTRGRRQ